MCLLTFMPEYVSPDMDRFAVAAKSNPDGFGFAILEKDKFITAHGMNFSEVADKFTDARTKHQGPAIFHFRWATHGSETVENCHPFYLGGDKSTMMGHNGILPVAIEKNDERSDTKVFAQDIMPAVGGITALDDEDYFKRLSAWATGSKLVFITHNPDTLYDWYIINEELGHWDKDMWWSNYSYEQPRYSYSSYGSYGSRYGGWSWDDDIVVVENGKSLVPADYDDEADLMSDDDYMTDLCERYEDCLDRARIFTTHIGDGIDFVECYNCCHSFYSEKFQWVTHCPECEQCLYCGMKPQCSCWDAVFELEAIDYETGWEVSK